MTDNDDQELPELPPRIARAAKSWRPGMTHYSPDATSERFAAPRRFDSADELAAAGEDPGATFMPGSSRLGEGEGFISRKVRERRAAGVDIDNIIASAFAEGFHGLDRGTYDARAILQRRAEARQHALRVAEAHQQALDDRRRNTSIEVTIDRDEPAKPILELLAVNPPHPSEMRAVADIVAALMDQLHLDVLEVRGVRDDQGNQHVTWETRSTP